MGCESLKFALAGSVPENCGGAAGHGVAVSLQTGGPGRHKPGPCGRAEQGGERPVCGISVRLLRTPTSLGACIVLVLSHAQGEWIESCPGVSASYVGGG